MPKSKQLRLHRWLTVQAPWPARLLGLLLLLVLGAAAGLAAVHYGLVVVLGLLVGLGLAATSFLFAWNGLLIAVGIAALLPFAVLPIRVGLTPSFLELTLLGVLGGWLLPPLARGDRRWHFSALDGLAWAFVALTFFSLLLGLGRGVNSSLLHSYAKLLLGLLAFFATRQLVREERQVRRFLTVFLLVAGLAALVGLVLYALPDRISLNLLTRLGVLGYPTTGRVLRYVEDDPNGLERAIGGSVDPNSFGGMLALAAGVALGEVLAAWRRLRFTLPWPRAGTQPALRPNAQEPGAPESTGEIAFPLLVALFLLLLACLYLTYSRAALGGFLIAALFLSTARYRRLWWGIAAVGLLVAVAVAAGIGGPVIERFRQGLLFQDTANQMRLAEFSNAFAIIRRYPVFGVGFGNAPDIDLSTGVSSLYLTIAERMGLVGLVAFLVFAGAALISALRRNDPTGRRLSLLAGAVAALAMGLLDHYFFNMDFPHMALLLWSVLGVATAERLSDSRF